MNSYVYDFKNSHVRKGEVELTSNLKPEFSFEYDAVSYSSVDGINTYQHDNVDVDLSPANIAEIEAFIATVEADPVEQLNADSRLYLLQTDWYAIRQMESGVEIPVDVFAKRAAARAAIT